MQIGETYRSEKFRIPWLVETRLGLWIDRIGTAEEQESRRRELRVLGLHAAVCCSSGRGFYFSPETGTVKVESGDVIIIFPDMPHCYHPDGAWRQQWIVWSGSEAEILDELGFLSRRKPIIPQSSAPFHEAYARLEEIIATEDATGALERKSILLRMIGALAAKARCSSRSPAEKAVAKIINRIDSAPEQEISVAALAIEAGISGIHFRRLFRAATGRSPMEYVIGRRIAVAEACLAGGMSIKETAATTGFHNLFYFMKIFKKVTGMTPGEFRR